MLQSQIQKILLDILLALLSLAGAYAVYYINKLTNKIQAETEKIKDDKQQNLFNDAIVRLNDLVIKTVTQIEQTTAKDLRQAVADGKVDKAELLALGSQAVNEIYKQLSDDTIQVLQTQINDIGTYIKDAVETAVYNIKTQG